jgi:hypothetical protein
MEDAFAETLPCSTPEPSIITFPATIELCNKIDPMQNPTSGWPDWTVFNLLGDCLHTYLCSFLNYRSRPIFGILFSVVICSYVLILTKNGPGNILGDFLQQLIWSPCPTYTHETVEPLLGPLLLNARDYRQISTPFHLKTRPTKSRVFVSKIIRCNCSVTDDAPVNKRESTLLCNWKWLDMISR